MGQSTADLLASELAMSALGTTGWHSDGRIILMTWEPHRDKVRTFGSVWTLEQVSASAALVVAEHDAAALYAWGIGHVPALLPPDWTALSSLPRDWRNPPPCWTPNDSFRRLQEWHLADAEDDQGVKRIRQSLAGRALMLAVRNRHMLVAPLWLERS